MRQLLVQVPHGYGKEVLNIAQAYDATNTARVEAMGNDEPVELIVVHISNQKVEGFLGDLESLPNLQVTLIPRGVIAMQPPADEAPEQVTDVKARSPIEIFLAGLQSVGSWKAFLGYAAAAGVVVWIGLYTNTNYLLVAAMLIAPFAGPAMNVAIATSRGDAKLLKRTLLRYFVALVVTIVVAGTLSFILQQEVVTSTMSDTSKISAVAVLLPLVAGAAGAVNLVQSERSSLVSGAAVGMLVAASLAPPAGLIGMASAMGRWDLAINGVFVLLLQLVGINLSASLVFRSYGLTSKGARYQRGKKGLFPTVLAVTFVALLGLLFWQFSDSPELQRSSREQSANQAIQQVVEDNDLVELVEANVRFPTPNIPGQNTLLVVMYVQRRAGVTESAEIISDRLTQTVQAELQAQGFNVTPLVSVNVLSAPDTQN
ncbi:DUF389 domain-containing protein [Gloeocapsopsis crepidinum LEGE 06123]|uniref:DUF389 domain-containing protein n=1 Tax=Gloeocapsopsis crepidinum LEGE 06123 TaxID=588587 RepID=A0ABR9UVS5_9CHRO|nr:DUF389 domain-containing protein [Gloeocapsopsis crepidinum]MBE9192125.1 DUF389 domain-containing protein [Gloeocapsopsis crepidinum LEGE 06123]